MGDHDVKINMFLDIEELVDTIPLTEVLLNKLYNKFDKLLCINLIITNKEEEEYGATLKLSMAYIIILMMSIP